MASILSQPQCVKKLYAIVGVAWKIISRETFFFLGLTFHVQLYALNPQHSKIHLFTFLLNNIRCYDRANGSKSICDSNVKEIHLSFHQIILLHWCKIYIILYHIVIREISETGVREDTIIVPRKGRMKISLKVRRCGLRASCLIGSGYPLWEKKSFHCILNLIYYKINQQ